MNKKQKLKPYYCSQGHIVGFIRWDGHGVSHLTCLRHSIDVSLPLPAKPDIAASIDSGAVICSICGAYLRWMPSRAAVELMLIRIKHANQDQDRMD